MENPHQAELDDMIMSLVKLTSLSNKVILINIYFTDPTKLK